MCSAALMCSPAQPKDGASSANKPQGQREGRQAENDFTCTLFSKSECFGKFYCGNTRIFFFLGSSISPFYPTVLSSGAGIAGNGHS